MSSPSSKSATSTPDNSAPSGQGGLGPSARDSLASLDFLLADAILDALGALERDPQLGHELRGRLRELRSYRVGVYRIIYELRDPKTVRVVSIRHRGHACGSDPR